MRNKVLTIWMKNGNKIDIYRRNRGKKYVRFDMEVDKMVRNVVLEEYVMKRLQKFYIEYLNRRKILPKSENNKGHIAELDFWIIVEKEDLLSAIKELHHIMKS